VSTPFTLRTDAGDEHVDIHEFEARVRRGDISPHCMVRFPPVTGERFVPAEQLGIYRSLHEPRRALFARTFRFGRFPWLTAAVILLNAGVYALTARQGPLDVDAMVRFGGKVGPLIIDVGQFWRLLTANFLHRDALHLVLNMFVLLNVGGAMENAYRALDYLALLLFSGLATMSTSLLLSDAVSVGASGMVYGCLGAVVVFGLKYRALLPARYRRIFGEAAIPTVLIFLWIGWTSSGVDNSAHFGGLLAGVALGMFLHPKLLHEPSRWWMVARAGMVASLLAAPFAAGALLRRMPPLRTERDDGFGISIQLPRDWRRGANRLGQLAYYNGLPGLGRATFAAEAVVLDESADVAEEAKKFVDERLRPQSLGPEVSHVAATSPAPTRIAERDGLQVDAVLEEPFGATRLVAYFVRRGELVYQLVFTHPAAFPQYAEVIRRMVQGLRFDEPRELREARARALMFPGAPWASATLGTALRQLGDAQAAIEALRTAVRERPTAALFRAQLARALLQAGQLEEACSASAQAVLDAPNDPQTLEADARCELSRGNPSRALERLQAARSVAPTDERLRRAEDALRTAVAPQR
jgi:membrane associated rhomboid family serine protease/tetratricopeptide (TPR) repeat protein